MKKIFYLMMIFSIVILAMNSCKEDPIEEPVDEEITITTNSIKRLAFIY